MQHFAVYAALGNTTRVTGSGLDAGDISCAGPEVSKGLRENLPIKLNKLLNILINQP
jgi:hypothetical protein